MGLCKTVVDSSKPHSLDEPRATIANTMHEITQQQLENVFKELENRIEQCIVKGDGYVDGYVEAPKFEPCGVLTS